VTEPPGRRDRRRRRASSVVRLAALVAWVAVLVAFWLGARGAEGGPLVYLRSGLDGLAERPWAPLAALGLYLLRPLLLVPITVANLAAGFLLGAAAGVPFAMIGTLLSASVGYAIGRFMGADGPAAEVAKRSPVAQALRRRGFESVVAGGLMYLHADMVNLPAGLLRVRYGTFLLGITLGNALTMTTAVLAGASVEGRLADARVTLDARYLILAAGLFVISLSLAYVLRRRWRATP
jgi:uncharacterized membrane protein YdjX (TVP38/TMEM64 family)